MRMYNEDAFGIFADASSAMTTVADGMGAGRSGRPAADIVVDFCKRTFDDKLNLIIEELVGAWWIGEHGESSEVPSVDRDDVREHVNALLKRRVADSMGDVAVLDAERRVLFDLPKRSILDANRELVRLSRTSSLWRGHGSTAVTALFADGHASIAWVGDSRVSRIRRQQQTGKNIIEALTTEHTLRNEYLRARPDITQADLDQLPGNVITRAIGMQDDLLVDTHVFALEKGDFFLLMSDGIFLTFSDEELIAAVTERGVDAATLLVDQGKVDRPGHRGDNIALVVVEIL